MTVSQSESLRLLERTAAEFARKERVHERQIHDQYPFGPLFSPVLQKAYAAGFFHAVLPEDLGGAGERMPPLLANGVVDPIRFAESRDRKAATPELGTGHPVSRTLRTLELGRNPLVYPFSPLTEAILFGGKNLMDR